MSMQPDYSFSPAESDALRATVQQWMPAGGAPIDLSMNNINMTPTWTTGPSGGGGYGGEGGGADGMEMYVAFLREQWEYQKEQQRQTAVSFLKTILEQYNMNSLANKVDDLVREWGSLPEVIAEKLRLTDEYKTRFKGLVGLQKRGITDVRNEAEYLQLETSYRSIFREVGLRDFLGTSGTQEEYDSIAKIVDDFSLSVNEVRARVGDAVRTVESRPEIRDAMSQYYGIDTSTLVAYTLDPVRTQNRINTMANAAAVGGVAAAAAMNIDVASAERYAGLAGGEDLSLPELQQQTAQARRVRDATTRLAEIERTELTDPEVLLAQAGVDTEAQKKIGTLQSRERARFSGSSAFDTRSLARRTTV